MEFYLVSRRIHFIGRNDLVGDPRRRYSNRFYRFDFFRRGEILLQNRGVYRRRLLGGDLLVPLYSSDHLAVRFLIDRHIGEVVPVVNGVVVVDDRVVDDRRRPVVVDDGGVIDVGHTHGVISRDGIKGGLRDDNRCRGEGQPADINGDGRRASGYNGCSVSPAMPGVVDFPWRQRNPADIRAA